MISKSSFLELVLNSLVSGFNETRLLLTEVDYPKRMGEAAGLMVSSVVAQLQFSHVKRLAFLPVHPKFFAKFRESHRRISRAASDGSFELRHQDAPPCSNYQGADKGLRSICYVVTTSHSLTLYVSQSGTAMLT